MVPTRTGADDERRDESPKHPIPITTAPRSIQGHLGVLNHDSVSDPCIKQESLRMATMQWCLSNSLDGCGDGRWEMDGGIRNCYCAHTTRDGAQPTELTTLPLASRGGASTPNTTRAGR